MMSLRKLLLWCIFGTCFFVLESVAGDTILVTDYGYPLNSRQNAVPAVKKALEACRTKNNPVLIFPPGRYDFWPQHSAERLYYESNTDVIPLRRCPILLEHFNGLTIDGQGADFIFHDRMQPITIDHCENITVTNLNIDWDIPLTAQAQVVDTGADYLDLAINILESPYLIEGGKILFVGEGWRSELWRWGVMEFDQHTKLIVPGTGDESCLGKNYHGYQAIEIRPGLIRMHHTFTRKPAIGNYLVLRHSARDHSGVFITNSKSITIEHLNMYHNAGLGVLSQYAENLFFKAIHFVPNPAKQRIFSGHDDGFQFSNCRGRIVVDSCRFLALMDDPINVHGTSVRIIKKINDRQLLCQFMHHQSVGFVWARPGEKVGFIENETQHTFGQGIVHSFWSINPEVFEITFTAPIPAATEVMDALENLTWLPDVWVKHSFFGSNRARGLLVTTPGKVLIENNVFESSGSAILIAGDANGWYESGAVRCADQKQRLSRSVPDLHVSIL